MEVSTGNSGNLPLWTLVVKMSREDACYNRIDETQLINVKGGFMAYNTKHSGTLDPIYLTASKATMTSSPTSQQPPKR